MPSFVSVPPIVSEPLGKVFLCQSSPQSLLKAPNTDYASPFIWRHYESPQSVGNVEVLTPNPRKTFTIYTFPTPRGIIHGNNPAYSPVTHTGLK